MTTTIPTKNTTTLDELASFAEIDFAELVRNNKSDHSKVSFTVQGDSAEIIRWCRRNFGQRGDGWDFTATNKYVEVNLWSSKLIVIWELWKN